MPTHSLHSSVGSTPSDKELQLFLDFLSYLFEVFFLLSLIIKDIAKAIIIKLVKIEYFIAKLPLH